MADVNKVIYDNKVIMDLTADTVQPEDVMPGKTFHLSNGSKSVGTLSLNAEGINFDNTDTKLESDNVQDAIVENNNYITNKLIIINSSNCEITKDSTKGVAPYNTSYGYTNITITDTSLEIIDGTIMALFIDAAVASANRNVRIRIGKDSTRWIPLFKNTTILAGHTYLTEGVLRLFVYSEDRYETGALHMVVDDNSDVYLRLYRTALEAGNTYDANYPILVSRTKDSNVSVGSYSSVYAQINSDTNKVAYINPTTGEITAPNYHGLVEGVSIGDSEDWLKSNNLINLNDIKYGVWTDSSGVESSISYGCRTSIIEVKSGEKYTLSSDNSLLYSNSIILLNNGSFVRREHKMTPELNITIVIPSNVNQIYCQFANSANLTSTITKSCLESAKVQLEKGEEATKYTPYVESNIQLTRAKADLEASNFLGWGMPSEAIELGMYNYVANDVCHKRYDRMLLDNLSWIKSTNYYYANIGNIYKKPIDTNTIFNGYCVKYKSSTTNGITQAVADGRIGVTLDGYLMIRDTTIDTVDALKTALADIYLYYELATEQLVTTQIADEIPKDLGDLNDFVYESDVTVSDVKYHVYWKVKPTGSNDVYGFALHPTSGLMYYIRNNKGTLAATSYSSNTNTQMRIYKDEDSTYNIIGSRTKASSITSGSTSVYGEISASNPITMTPSTGTITAKNFVGNLIGKANGHDIELDITANAKDWLPSEEVVPTFTNYIGEYNKQLGSRSFSFRLLEPITDFYDSMLYIVFEFESLPAGGVVFNTCSASFVAGFFNNENPDTPYSRSLSKGPSDIDGLHYTSFILPFDSSWSYLNIVLIELYYATTAPLSSGMVKNIMGFTDADFNAYLDYKTNGGGLPKLSNKEITNFLLPTSYINDGFLTNNIKSYTGGYIKLGNFIIVNLVVNATLSAGEMSKILQFRGLPLPTLQFVSCVASDTTFKADYACDITNAGILTCYCVLRNQSSTSAQNLTVNISAMYISK